MMKLIVGLGNPWKKYEETRHNIGFVALEKFVVAEKLWGFVYTEKYGAELLEVVIGGEKILFVKPMTFMNMSGWPVAKLANFYKVVPENILIVHDEIDLIFGKIKSKVWWSHAGHNGLRDIIGKLGSRDFHRVRIGIGRSENEYMSVTDYVLGKFSKKESEVMEDHMFEIFERIDSYLK